MILSCGRILELMHDQKKSWDDRLLITPILDIKRQVAVGNCSIDVRLGQRFRIPRRTKLDRLDHLSDNHVVDVERYKDDHQVLIGDYFVLHPGQFVLGETLEWIHLPRNLGAYVIGRSSWGRDGLIIATATGVHPCYSGILALELNNLGEIPLRLYPGLTIAQLFIHEVSVNDVEIQNYSHFSGSTGPESGNAAGPDRDVIRKLRKARGFPP